MRPFFWLGAVVVLAGGMNVQAAEQRFTSGPGHVSLVELFTSEGCSSCPPAEQWLGKLRDEPGLWRDFVPVEFHVNYWDRLGWPDRFASREATEREYAYAAAWNSASVYTPCVVRDGEESKSSSKLSRARDDAPGELTVSIDDAGQAHVKFSAAAGSAGVRAGYDVQVAVLGSGFTSRVTGGENRGETLRHEFVACGEALQKMSAAPDGSYQAEIALPKSRVADIPKRAVAVWIVRHGDLKPVQATGGWLADALE